MAEDKRKFGKKEFDRYVNFLSKGSKRGKERAELLKDRYKRWIGSGVSKDEAAKKALASAQQTTARKMKKKTGNKYWNTIMGRALTRHQKDQYYTVRFKSQDKDLPYFPSEEELREKKEIERLQSMAGILDYNKEEEAKKYLEEKKEAESEEKGKSGIEIQRVCPRCGSTPVLTTETPGILYCPSCGAEFPAKTKSEDTAGTAISNIIHSSITTIVISALIGLMIPTIFGSQFGMLGTTLIGVGIIFLGLSKI